MAEWKRVTEEPPQEADPEAGDDPMLVLRENGDMRVAWVTHYKYGRSLFTTYGGADPLCGWFADVTHWMPLPEPPDGE